jgi:hypothetical protein
MRNGYYWNPLSDDKIDTMRYNTYKFIIQDYEDLVYMCNKVTIKMPASTPVELQWIGGITSFGGRVSGAVEFQTSFYVLTDVPGGSDADSIKFNSLDAIYRWRNEVIRHQTGQIKLARNYKKEAYIEVYKPDMTMIKAVFRMTGCWPVSIADLSMDVSSDTPMSLDVTFRADRIFREDSSEGLLTR